MFLEILTFVMFALVIALKYGAVNRMMKLNMRLRKAEYRVKKQKENLKLFRSERLVAERDEAGLERQRTSLMNELRTVTDSYDQLKSKNTQTIEELLRKNTNLSPELQGGDPQEPEEDEFA